ncbi:hypothetical protein V0288_13440 [Pannus brasiliensis CCIBt3594]|uniref:DUF4164 family protein n=1 Tax=Pannus brasiliensis CCIBt3594 TaxID=1427578 RepID=A0AAW9QXC6_9CHRO
MSGETVTYSLEAILMRIEGKIDTLQKDVTDLKIGQTELKGEMRALDEKLSGEIRALDERLSGEIKALDGRLSGEIKTLDERLSTKIEGLNDRVKYQEFTNRGILIALVVAILGGAAKLFGFIGNP